MVGKKQKEEGRGEKGSWERGEHLRKKEKRNKLIKKA